MGPIFFVPRVLIFIDKIIISLILRDLELVSKAVKTKSKQSQDPKIESPRIICGKRKRKVLLLFSKYSERWIEGNDRRYNHIYL